MPGFLNKIIKAIVIYNAKCKNVAATIGFSMVSERVFQTRRNLCCADHHFCVMHNIDTDAGLPNVVIPKQERCETISMQDELLSESKL